MAVKKGHLTMIPASCPTFTEDTSVLNKVLTQNFKQGINILSGFCYTDFSQYVYQLSINLTISHFNEDVKSVFRSL